MPQDLRYYLTRFNRKERFFLVGWSLGNARFKLSAPFRRIIEETLGLPVPIEAFAAMDYHLDWIYASVSLARGSDPTGVHDNSAGLITGTQEDIDLLVAFQAESAWQIVMIEVKGVTRWTNKQTASKARRLGQIFGRRGDRWQGIRPHFVLASPTEPTKLDCKGWPTWMVRKSGRPHWMKMEIPSGLIRSTRCDEQGRVTAKGKHWKVVGR